MKIRTALTNIEPDQKLPALIAALEEEMFAIWGQTGPVTVRSRRVRPDSPSMGARDRRMQHDRYQDFLGTRHMEPMDGVQSSE